MIWTGIGIFCFIILVAVGLMQSTRFKAFRHVYGRAMLNENEFAAKYFPEEQREIAVKVRSLLSPYLAIRAERINPSDVLVDELGLSAGLSDGLDGVSFVGNLESEFQVKFGEEDYIRMQTFRDVVEIVADKLNKSRV